MRRSTCLLGLLLEADGWLVLEDLAEKYAASESELRTVAIESIGVDMLDLGDQILLTHPMLDNREAVAAFFDEREAEWRETMGWEPRTWGDDTDG